MSGFPRPRTVRPRPLAEVAGVLGIVMPASRPAVRGVAHASAAVRPDDLFAALPGANRHGAEFAADAAAAGAAAVLTDPSGAALAAATGLPVLTVPDPRAVLGTVAADVYGDPTSRVDVVGITGTTGKTSTTYLVEAGLRAAGTLTGLIGTVETRIGDTSLGSVRTTPEATDLQALFAYAAEAGVGAFAMEVSSHALALGRVTGTQFAVGAFTNLGVDHLDFHADIGAYFDAKASLFDGRCRHEVVNLDDPAGRKLVRTSTVTVSAAGDPAATWRAVDIRGTGYDQRFTAVGPDGLAAPAGVAVPGRHNIENALVALACLVALDVPPDVAARAVAACPGVPGRMERVSAGPVLGVVDYAHSPDAVAAVLRALRDITPGRLICVLGAGGDRDPGKRPLMGQAAADSADLVIVTDDNPRTEDPGAIRAQVLRGARQVGGADSLEIDGRAAAIAAAAAAARPGDTVAVLGKGHEQGQEIAGLVYRFDDRAAVRAALAAGDRS